MTNSISAGQPARRAPNQAEAPSSSPGSPARLNHITDNNAAAALPLHNHFSSMTEPNNHGESLLSLSARQPAQLARPETVLEGITAKLRSWVAEGERAEQADRYNVMNTILAANPGLNPYNSTRLIVYGDLTIANFTRLTSLPEGLSVRGNLNLAGCTNLTSLPNNLTVDADLSLHGCTNLKSLAEGLSVRGNLNLAGCTSLTSLPNKSYVGGGDLNLSGCTSLKSLPDNLTFVNGNLTLNGCTNLTSLPDDLTVRGNLNLSGCTNLTSLPNNLTVAGALKLKNCTKLTSLPDNLTFHGALNLAGCIRLESLPDNLTTVHGGLDLYECTSLESLPNNLTVRGELDLTGCTKLTSLPNNLNVGGGLYFSNCTSLKSLPNKLTFNGDLSLAGCTKLKSLPDNLIVHGDLSLAGCTKLKSLPKKLTVHGDLDLYECTSLKSLPDDLNFGGDLNLQACTKLESLPKKLTVHGGLDLARCTNLKSLPDNLTVVGGDLNLSGCSSLEKSLLNNLTDVHGGLNLHGYINLESLPDNLTVNGALNLEDCTSLKSLPKKLTVHGNLNLTGCTKLKSLPDDLNVHGNLNLADCTNLTSLPDDLNVHGNLNLADCTNLTSLAEGLSVRGNLNLSGCTCLESLPDNFTFEEYLDLSGCIRLTTLPRWITEPCPDANSARTIDLTSTNLDQDTLNRVINANNSPNNGIEFILPVQLVTLPEAISGWLSTEQSAALNIDSWGLNDSEKQELSAFLYRLRTSADARKSPSKAHINARVVEFLQKMQENLHDFRSLAMQEISDAITDCADRITYFFDELEKATRIKKAQTSADPYTDLITLAKSFIALEVVHRHAAAKIQADPSLQREEIEVYLAFQIKLKEDLDLPVSAQSMLFERLAKLTPDDIQKAKKEAAFKMADENSINDYLDQWEPWQQFQRGKTAEQLTFESLQPTTSEFALDSCCVISLTELGNIEKPVCIGSSLYDLDVLLKHWIEKGTNPATMQKLSLNEVRRLPR